MDDDEDYDILSAKLLAAERRERQLLDTTATCRMLRRELNTAKAKLAEVEAGRDNSHQLWKDACVRSGKNSLRADAAEAALPAVYRLGLEAVAAYLQEQDVDLGPWSETIICSVLADEIHTLLTPTAAELMARIQTGEKQ